MIFFISYEDVTALQTLMWFVHKGTKVKAPPKTKLIWTFPNPQVISKPKKIIKIKIRKWK